MKGFADALMLLGVLMIIFGGPEHFKALPPLSLMGLHFLFVGALILGVFDIIKAFLNARRKP